MRSASAVGEEPTSTFAGFSAPVVAGHSNVLRLVRTPNGKTAAVLTGRTHLYEGRGVGPGGARGPDDGGRRRPHGAADQRLRRAEP